MDTVAEIIEELQRQLARGDLSDYEKSSLVVRAYRRLSKACYCLELVCCPHHSVHTTPHRNCLFR